MPPKGGKLQPSRGKVGFASVLVGAMFGSARFKNNSRVSHTNTSRITLSYVSNSKVVVRHGRHARMLARETNTGVELCGDSGA